MQYLGNGIPIVVRLQPNRARLWQANEISAVIRTDALAISKYVHCSIHLSCVRDAFHMRLWLAVPGTGASNFNQ